MTKSDGDELRAISEHLRRIAGRYTLIGRSTREGSAMLRLSYAVDALLEGRENDVFEALARFQRIRGGV